MPARSYAFIGPSGSTPSAPCRPSRTLRHATRGQAQHGADTRHKHALGSEERQLGQARIHVGACNNAGLAQQPANAGVGKLGCSRSHAERRAAGPRLGLDNLEGAGWRDECDAAHTNQVARRTSGPAFWMRTVSAEASASVNANGGVAWLRSGRMVSPAWPPMTGTSTPSGGTPMASATKARARITSRWVTPVARAGHA